MALIPTQIYSSVLDFLHFGILLYIVRRKKADGQVAAFYLIFYSIGRFVLEFFRGDLIRGSVGKPIDFTIYQPVYFGGRNCDSDYTYKKEKCIRF